MFIFRHADVNWGHELLRGGFVLLATSKKGCLTELEHRVGDDVCLLLATRVALF